MTITIENHGIRWGNPPYSDNVGQKKKHKMCPWKNPVTAEISIVSPHRGMHHCLPTGAPVKCVALCSPEKLRFFLKYHKRHKRPSEIKQLSYLNPIKLWFLTMESHQIPLFCTMKSHETSDQTTKQNSNPSPSHLIESPPVLKAVLFEVVGIANEIVPQPSYEKKSRWFYGIE